MKTVLFDATRMFMRSPTGTPTGIDRVNHAYGSWLLSEPGVRVVPVSAWGGVPMPLSRAAFAKILARDHVTGVSPSLAWDRLVSSFAEDPDPRQPSKQKAEAGGLGAAVRRYAPAAARTLSAWRPSNLSGSDIYLNVAHFGLEQPGLLQRLRARNIRPVAMIHDLIPIAHPEFCGPSAARWHERRVDAVLEHADLVITNSASTAAELTAHAHGRRMPTVQVAPLGLEPAFLRPMSDASLLTPYFVCVGTIEPRKNLTFLLTVWRRLAERLGDAAPRLVLAGRRGWENESVIDHLERSPAVVRLVREVAGLADGELARLIGGATALLAPSFSEGFNLPVAEALAMGTPVIASDIPVHRELAARAQLIDPLDGPAWLKAIEAAVSTPRRRPPTRPMSWPDHFAIVRQALGW